MLRKLWPLLSLGFLLNSCAHGPIITPWVSDPVNSDAFVYTPKTGGAVQTLAYLATGGFAIYPPQSFQALTDYCAARTAAGPAAPELSLCVLNSVEAGFDCHPLNCGINAAGNGAECQTSATLSSVSFSNSNDYVALSPADQTQLLAFCNVAVTP